MDSNNKKIFLIDLGLALLMSAVAVAAVVLFYYRTYGVIDDGFIAQVLNGAYTGTPDAHVVYIKYPLAFLFKSLFDAIPAFNWHFAFLEACFIVCVFTVVYRICSVTKKTVNKLLLGGLFIFLFWLCMAKMALTAHYSMCAATLAATGIFLFATIKDESTALNRTLNYIYALILLWASYSLRARTLFMLLPLAGVVFLYKFFKKSPYFKTKKIISFLIFPVILFIGLGGIELAHNSAYKTDVWQRFLKINDARTTLYDFYGLPEYEGHEELYESLNISEARRYMYEKYYLEFTDGVEENALETIADARVEEYKEKLPFLTRLGRSVAALPYHLTLKTYYPVNLVTAIGFLLLFVASIVLRKWKLTLFTALATVAFLIPWTWMIYMMKPTSRVTMGIWLSGLLFIIAMIADGSAGIRSLSSALKERLGNKKAFIIKIAAAAAAFALMITAVIFSYTKVQNHVYRSIKSGNIRADLEEYCAERKDRLYIYESEMINSLGYDVNRINNSLLNIYWPGGWTSFLDENIQVWERYGIKDIEKAMVEEDNVYIVALKDTDMDYWVDFYKETYPGVRIESADEVDIGGTEFTVYKLKEK